MLKTYVIYKVVKTKAIGNESVRQCRAYFESMGFITDVIELTGRFRKYKDCFAEEFDKQIGVDSGFDVIAINKGFVLLIQVTTTTPKNHGPYQWFADQYPNIQVVQYVRVKGRNNPSKIFIYEPFQDGHVLWDTYCEGNIKPLRYKSWKQK